MVWLHNEAARSRLTRSRVTHPHLSVEPVEHILLRDHLCPVPVHLLPQVCVLTLLQLHQSGHLHTKEPLISDLSNKSFSNSRSGLVLGSFTVSKLV